MGVIGTANIKLHQSETREAQSLIVEAQHLMETQDTDPAIVAQAHHSLGISYAMSRQFTEARASFKLGWQFELTILDSAVCRPRLVATLEL